MSEREVRYGKGNREGVSGILNTMGESEGERVQRGRGWKGMEQGERGGEG